MREAWRPVLFADKDLDAKAMRDPVAPAERSPAADRKASTHTLADGTTCHSFRMLLDGLATIVRNTCRPIGAPDDAPTFRVVTSPSPAQHRALDLIDTINV